MLSVVSNGKFMGFSDGTVVSWCPVLNLLFISMNRMSIWVYRLNGERIYAINNKLIIEHVAFINDGSLFCVSGVDGTVKIYDSNNGKLINVLPNFHGIKLISWNLNNYSSTSQFEDLFRIDIIEQLPQVVKFTSKLNYLIVVDEASITFNFNNLLTVRVYECSQVNIVGHLDNNDLFKQIFVAKSSIGYNLVHLHSNLSAMDKKYTLSIIQAHCKLIALMAHIKAQFQKISDEIAPFLSLFDKYFSLLILEYPGEAKVVIRNYFAQYILTGLIEPKSKDFWLNQFGERGYKRLTKLGNSCYDNIRKIVFSQVILSVERITIIINELLGVATWVVNSGEKFHFGLDVAHLNKLLLINGTFLKGAYKIIWEVNNEQKLFNNFFDMIKHEFIDKLTKEDDLESYLKANKGFNYSQALKYINKNLFQSMLLNYANIATTEYEILQTGESIEDGQSILALFDEIVQTNDSLIDSFKSFFPSILTCNEYLELEGFEKISLKNHDNTTVICGIKDSMVQLMKLNDKFEVTVVKRINVPNTISYELLNNKLVVFLRDRILQVDVANVWETEQEVIELSTLSFSEIPLDLANPAKMAVSDSFGCILDSNKQNYMVFRLN